MAIVPLGTNFDLGFQSDTSRGELNPRAAYRMRDYIPQLDAALRKRGGWSYGSPDLNGFASATSITSLGYLPFPNDGHVVAVGESGAVFQVKRFDGAGGAVITDTGDRSIVPTWPIFWHKTGTTYYGIILGGLGQSAKVPKRYYDTGSLVYTVAPLGGTPPKARMGFSWGDYLVLGNYYDPTDSDALKNYRWAFSAAGDPNSYALSGVSASTLDFPEEMVAGAPVLNSILALGYGDCHIVTGDTPPPGGNLSRKVLFSGLGTFDGRTMVTWRNYAVWANASGVWQSDGATLTDLTAQGGISTYYQQIVKGFSTTQGWSATAGIYRDRYILTIHDGDDVIVTTLVCDLNRKVWTEWTNIPSCNFARRPAGPGTMLFGGDEELFFAHHHAPRVGTLSSLWEPSLTTASDADGTAVLPELQVPYYRIGSLDSKRIRRLFLGYDLRSAGGEATLDCSYVLTPEDGAAYTLADSLPETTEFRRRHLFVGKSALGIALKIGQSGPSADTRLYSVEGEGHPWESYR